MASVTKIQNVMGGVTRNSNEIHKETDMTRKQSRILLMFASASLVPMLGMANIAAQEYGTGERTEAIHILPTTPSIEASEFMTKASAEILNGNFETCDLAGWGIYRAGNTAGWFAYSGTTSPQSGHPIYPPQEGLCAATSDQTGANVQILYQDITLDGNYELSMTLYTHNWAPAYYSPQSLCYNCGFPNQQYRVDIMLPGADLLSVDPADILYTVFQTMPGDPSDIPPAPYNVDLTPWAGQTVRLRFAEADNALWFNGSVDDIKLTRLSIDAAIDIKPGSCPNPFNGKSRGSVPVAIIGSADFDVTTVDPASVALAGVPALENWAIEDMTQPVGENSDCHTCFDADDPANYNCDLWDATVDPAVPGTDGVMDSYCGDGYPDLVLHFDTQALAEAIGVMERDACVTLELTGTTNDATPIPITGSDSVVIRTK